MFGLSRGAWREFIMVLNMLLNLNENGRAADCAQHVVRFEGSTPVSWMFREPIVHLRPFVVVGRQVEICRDDSGVIR